MSNSTLPNINLDSLVRTAMGGPNTSWVPQTVGKLENIEQQKETESEPVRQQIVSDAASDKKLADDRFKGIDPVDLKPWTQKPPENDPTKAFASPAFIFAQLASAFTHTPMLSSLNAGAAAMNAIRQNDMDTYNKAYQAWKDNTELALKRHQVQYEDYQAAMDKMKSDTAEGSSLLNVLAAKYGDQQTLALNEAGLYKELDSLWSARQNTALAMAGALPDLEIKNMQLQAAQGLLSAKNDLDAAMSSGDAHEIQNAQQKYAQAQQNVANIKSAFNPTASPEQQLDQLKIDAYNQSISQFQKDHGRAPNAQENATILGGILRPASAPVDPDDPNIQAEANLIATYRQAPLSSYALRTPQGAAVLAAIQKINPNYDSTQYNARNKAVMSFAPGQKNGDLTRFFNVSIQHLNTLERLGSALKNSDSTAYNEAKNAFEAQFGSAAPTTFDAVSRYVSDEVTKAILGSAGGVTDRSAGVESFRRAQSPEQLLGAITAIKDLEGGQLRGLRKQYQVGTGLDDFDKFLFPDTLNALDSGSADKTKNMPAVGEVRKGYKYLGGDPSNPSSWTRMQ